MSTVYAYHKLSSNYAFVAKKFSHDRLENGRVRWCKKTYLSDSLGYVSIKLFDPIVFGR